VGQRAQIGRGARVCDGEAIADLLRAALAPPLAATGSSLSTRTRGTLDGSHPLRQGDGMFARCTTSRSSAGWGRAISPRISLLLEAASIADGHRALGEHQWLDLVQGAARASLALSPRERP